MEKDVTYQATARSISHSRSDVSIRGFTVVIDEPEKLDGTNAGPNPKEMDIESDAPVSDNPSSGTTVEIQIGG